MSSPIISVEHLSKKYRITHQGRRQQYETLRDVLAAKSKNMLARLRPGKTGDSNGLSTRSTNEDFWALKDVSFQVQQGEVLGIIGRNGAGKSTLLKILSRITDPTEGRVTIRGRVASLLEVGTGFHQELTGRENIFLNGAILGMARVEIKRKFDEIVAFSEVEKFLDTPVKRYSSGMYVRLAFAVAAHLEPEILIVDEVLAVGDAEFQKKCLGKMQDVASKEGRTVLFVSHNIPSVSRLCSVICWLDGGRVREMGKTELILNSYLRSNSSDSSEWTRPVTHRQKQLYIQHISVTAESGDSQKTITAADSIVFTFTIISDLPSALCQAAVRISTADGIPVFTTASTDSSCTLTLLDRGQTQFRFVIPGNFLTPGWHNVICAILVPGGELIDVVADQIGFEIHPSLNHATHFNDGRLGLVTPLIEWSLNTSCDTLR